MHSKLYSIMAVAMSSVVYGATIAQRDTPNEIVYLTNCLGDGIEESQMNYYKDYSDSKAGQLPDSIAYIQVGSYQTWEGQSVTGTFIGSSVQFTSTGLDSSTPIGQATGSGSNGFAFFTCYREQEISLYSDGALTCTKLYSCAHYNHIESTQTQVTLSGDSTEIQKAVSGQTAFGNINSAFDSSSNTCSDTGYGIGSGCQISFSCSIENQNVFTAMSQLLINKVGANINGTTVTVPATCAESRICVQAPGVEKCCDPTTAPANTFPMSGKVEAFNIDESNPSNPSLQASLSYDITCPAPPGCNNELCGAIAGAVGAISLDPAFAVLGVILGFACLACN